MRVRQPEERKTVQERVRPVAKRRLTCCLSRCDDAVVAAATMVRKQASASMVIAGLRRQAAFRKRQGDPKSDGLTHHLVVSWVSTCL